MVSWRNGPQAEFLARLSLGALIVLAPELLGGGPIWAIVGIAALSLACLAWTSFTSPARVRSVPLLAAVMGICTGWTGLQALPISCGWVAWLAPESARQSRLAAQTLGRAAPALCTLSRDPGATELEIVKGIAIVATFLATWLYVSSRGRRQVLWFVAWSTLCMAVIALVHAALELDRVFGVYTPFDVKREVLLAPLMNANHLGAFVAFGTPIWIGLTYRDDEASVRLLGYVAVLISSVTTALSLSRGAIGQLVASLIFMIWLTVTRRHREETEKQSRTRRGIAALAIASAIGITAYFLGARITQEFKGSDSSKLALLEKAFQFAGHNLAIGVGRGAFSSAFVAFEGHTARFAYPEDFLAQWVSEWGLPVTLLLLCGVAISLVRASAGRVSLARLGAATALFAYAAQNLVDFGFEQLGVAVVVAAVLATYVAPAPERDLAPAPRRRRTAEIAWSMTAVGTIAVVALAPIVSKHDLRAVEATLRAESLRGDDVAFRRSLETAVDKHPSEPTLPLLAATHAISRHIQGAGPWLNRAMQLAPGWASPHYLAYQWLWQNNRRSQAILELRAALEIDVYPYDKDICRLVENAPKLALLAAPERRLRRTFLELATQCVPPGHPSQSVINDVLLQDFPESTLGLERKALDLHRSGHSDEGLAAIAELIRAQPSNERALAIRAQMFAATGQTQEALDATNEALPLLDDGQRAPLLTIKALALARLGNTEAAEATIGEVRRLATTDVRQLADSFVLEGRVQSELRHPGQAFRAFREAYKIDQDPRHLSELAALAEQIGDRPQALWAYVQMCAQEPLGGGCARRDQLMAPQAGNLPQ